ncbi:ABC-2 family transporter protein, partial [Patescibacteria group bacterium]|nr:ABC-2 family transporter protein [Patescibacteria group bacterium]
WDVAFSDSGRILFGYDRAKILTYVFGLIIVKAFVLSAKSADVAGEIAGGGLSNYLIKPVNYFKYWLTRDISSKALNISFALGESALLFLVLKPPFFIQTNFLSLLMFTISIILAMFIFFVLLFITSSIPFWVPEAAWGVHFLITVVAVEFLSGALFPLDVLPLSLQNVLNYTPFPYMIFFPLQIYLGKITGLVAFKGIFVSGIWAVTLWFVMNSVWRKGLKVYQAHGR